MDKGEGGDATRISVIRGLTLARPVGWLFRNSRQVGRARGHAPNRFWVATPWRQDQLIPRETAEGSRPRGGSRESAVYPPGLHHFALARYSPSHSGFRGRAGRIATQSGAAVRDTPLVVEKGTKKRGTHGAAEPTTDHTKSATEQRLIFIEPSAAKCGSRRARPAISVRARDAATV